MSKTINNLSEFLDWRGCGDDPYSWARAFYKYTDCGPWASFLLKGGADVYYEDIRRPNKPAVTNESCIGITIGSIVEGSEQSAGPYVHKFPFAAEEFERSCADMERVTSFYWKRDNSDWYCVWDGTDVWHVTSCWGDIEWMGDTEPPEDLVESVVKAIENDWQDDPKHSGCVVQTIPHHAAWYEKQDPDWKPMDLGVRGATIHSFTNDTCLEDE